MRGADGDAAGRVALVDLPLATYTLRASSLDLAQTRSATQQVVTLTASGPAPDFSLVLPGVGTVGGTVFQSDGLAPLKACLCGRRGQSNV